ncbi:PIG-L family deacetylase [Glycomyces paridis]|uniref:PIG-L family deacetylase n=1 Tax=Glycomyces paridis TaxID=2126555 RepID=UPI0013050F6A|nr:PIG-L family deacetylase [Glycomyces paridis]
MPSPRRTLRRRDLLVGGLAGLAVTAAAAESVRALGEAAGEPPFPEPTRTGPIHMQILAHPDDCLYFINPRVARVLDDGAGLCTVVLTAGEADGRNTWNEAAPADYAGYAAARDNGLRRAYARMALGDPDAPWDRHLACLDSGQDVELCVLRDRPQVHVLFCSLWTNLGRLTGDFTRLLTLWEGGLDASVILPPDGSPLRDEATVDRATVQATLLELIDRYRPVALNTLDPDPDPVVGDKLGAEQRGYSDHIDHTAAALFAWEAAATWGRSLTVESWRGYYNRRWPGNLGRADLDVKGDAIDVYAWNGGAACDHPAGCGDRLIAGPGAGTTYGHATHPRYETALTTAAYDDRIRPLAVRGNRLHALGDTGWEDLGGPDVLPHLARSGTRLYAVSAAHTHDPAAHIRDVHTLDLATGAWQRLGNPGGQGPAARTIGRVTAAADARTELVCVRHPDGGLAVRTRPLGGAWGTWTRLTGPAVHEAPAALAADGAFTLLAATPDSVAVWEGDGTDWEQRGLDLPGLTGAHLPAGAVTAALAPDGRIVIASRAAESGDVVLHLGRGDEWKGSYVPLEGGVLAPAIALGPDGALAVACDDGSGAPAVLVLELADLDLPAAGTCALLSLPWSRGDLTAIKRPALAYGSDGALRLWAVGVDGELWTAGAEPGERPPAGWEPAA